MSSEKSATASDERGRPVDAAAQASAMPDLSRAMERVALGLLAAVILARLLVSLAPEPPLFLTGDYFTRADIWWLLAAIALLYGLTKWQPSLAPRRWMAVALGHPQMAVRVALGFVFLVALAGTYVVHGNYDYVRDELMAHFDADIFAHGLFMAPVPAAWRDFVPALLPRFGVAVTGHEAWVSTYLPANAAFRALIGTVLVPQLANPLLAAVAVYATWSLARLFWPERRDAAVVAVLLLATSTQVLFMAMTSFAMTGHLAFNLLWLRLFLRNDRAGHLGACAVGLVACGWHQLAFHPMFVAPFVLHLWWSKRWAAAAGYSAFYTSACVLWTLYGRMAGAAAGVALEAGFGSGFDTYWSHSLDLLSDFSPISLLLMLLNLLRFAAWQNPLLLALVLLSGLAPPRVRNRVPQPLVLATGGVAITLIVATAVIAFQAHGWGYRYLHGYIGIFCLLAAHAWVQLVPADKAQRPAMWGPLIAASAYVLCVQLPGQALQIHATLAPRIEASRVIATSGISIVVVDQRGLFDAEDLVRNDPFLQTAPMILNLTQLDDRLIARLCDHGRRVAVFDRTATIAQALLGTDLESAADAAALARRAPLVQSLPCLVPLASR